MLTPIYVITRKGFGVGLGRGAGEAGGGKTSTKGVGTKGGAISPGKKVRRK